MPVKEVERPLGFNTRALHVGYDPGLTTHARAVSIYQSTSFTSDDRDHAARLFALEEFGNIYTRVTNPMTAVLEARVAWLENGLAALALSGGQAAQFLALSTIARRSSGSGLRHCRRAYYPIAQRYTPKAAGAVFLFGVKAVMKRARS